MSDPYDGVGRHDTTLRAHRTGNRAGWRSPNQYRNGQTLTAETATAHLDRLTADQRPGGARVEASTPWWPGCAAIAAGTRWCPSGGRDRHRPW